MKKKDIEEFLKEFDETVYMTIRYAHNRQTFAPTMVRKLLEARAKLTDFSLSNRDDTLQPPNKDWISPFATPSCDLRDLYEKYGTEEELKELRLREDGSYYYKLLHEFRDRYKSKNGIKHAIRDIEKSYETPEERRKKVIRVMALRKILEELDD